MAHMFKRVGAFDQDIGRWQTRRVTDMSHMFDDARAFNQKLDRWQTQRVTDMSYMFMGALEYRYICIEREKTFYIRLALSKQIGLYGMTIHIYIYIYIYSNVYSESQM